MFGYEFIGAEKANITFGEKIDWGAKPPKGEAKTHLWKESLNRHFHFSTLSMTYLDSGNEKYALELVAHRSFKNGNPRFNHQLYSSAARSGTQ